MTVEPFENAQPNEQPGQILVAIVDETYAVTDDDNWDRERETYRLGLEAEFHAPFQDGNIGPGADLPAFITLLTDTASVPIWSLLLAAFLLGDPVNKNLSAWSEIAKRLRSFFSRPVCVNRHGGAVLAVEAVFDQLGEVPKSLKLLSYRTQSVLDTEQLGSLDPCQEIEDALPTLHLGMIRHVFEIEADSIIFRISVEGKATKILRLE